MQSVLSTAPTDWSETRKMLKNIRLGFKNLNERLTTGRSKTENSENVLQVIEANPVSSTLRVSGDLGICLLLIVSLTTSANSPGTAEFGLFFYYLHIKLRGLFKAKTILVEE